VAKAILISREQGPPLTRIFADAAYLVALNSAKDQHHSDSAKVQADLKRAGHLADAGELFISDLVLIEAVQELLADCGFIVARSVFRDFERNHTILNSKPADVSKGFYELCSKYKSSATARRGLGLVDAVSILHMRRNKIGLIISTDTVFDRVPALQRIWVHNLAGFR